MPLFDSEPALAENERKVKRGLTGVPSAVLRIHLPPAAWAPRGTLNRPQSTSKTCCAHWWHLAPNSCLVGFSLISRHLLGASNTSKRFREALE